MIGIGFVDDMVEHGVADGELLFTTRTNDIAVGLVNVQVVDFKATPIFKRHIRTDIALEFAQNFDLLFTSLVKRLALDAPLFGIDT